jgi:DNA-directed RNA polymerase subunit M/transcription elongation factor TFIIS
MTSIRELGHKALSTLITKNKNVELVEKYIYNFTDTDDEYMNLLYESVGIIGTSSDRTQAIKTLITNIYGGVYGWNHPVYSEYKQKLEEEDQFLMNPFEIEEGVLECKCGSKRTISFQRQTRSADEGSTTFAQCVECGTKWRHNN